MKRILVFVGALFLSCLSVQRVGAKALVEGFSRVDSEGRIVPVRVSVDERFRNPGWCEQWEDEFADRADSIIRTALDMGRIGGNTYFENEKRTYGQLMLQIVGGKVEGNLKTLQGRDAQAGSWHRHTEGIDYYACFTLKHQMRKYFYFGELLDDEYSKKMYEGAKVWTQKDPLRRPHHAYEPGKSGWGPDAKNSWVDVRGTDNLFLMRTTSVYLMAEETGNEQTRRIYKERFATFVKSLYRIGNGEWDSENYLGHSIAPVHNLYDFAKDPQVKLLAKACLDWFYATGAVKYRRGGFNGPTKRDYNHAGPFEGSAAAMLWVMFGDAREFNTELESDEVHVITSAYRAAEAVVKLARKEFAKPVEIFAAKPNYSDPQNGDYSKGPACYETHYFGESFQFGSLAKGTHGGDINGFKILVDNSETGVDYVQSVPGPDPRYAGSAKYQSGKISGENRVAQYRNMAVWLVDEGDSPWLWVLPKSIGCEQADGVMFLKAEKTWLAVHPLNLRVDGPDEELTERVNYKVKKDRKEPLWPDHYVISAKGGGGAFCGYAVEIGEEATHGGYAEFKRAVLSKASVDDSRVQDGVVEYVGTNGDSVGMEFAEKLEEYKVFRDGELHDWRDHRIGYGQVDSGDRGLIHQDWLGGTLTVRAGGSVFECSVTDNGTVRFRNE